MAVSSRHMTRHHDYSRLFIALGVIAGVMALAPIVAAIAGLSGTGVGPRTAFASAPSGEYVVFGRNEGAVDVISVARPEDPGALTEITRVPHIDGFTSTGAVSPDGRRLALISVDGGTASHPVASLNVIDMETGRITRAAANVTPGQVPLWSPDGGDLVFTRMPSGNEVQGPIHLLRVSRNGDDARTLDEFANVLGVYPSGYDYEGRLVTVVLDGAGSAVDREGVERIALSSSLTRDWKVSPDGRQIAFVEVQTTSGVAYLARTARLDGRAVEALSAAVSALGTAWDPATNSASFGVEPAGADPTGRIQSLTAPGFDVPLGYSASGKALIVNHWSGASFAEPGRPQLQVLAGGGRETYEDQTRFYGWASR
ncbi:MAG: hypothetical protein IPF51_11940 [Dehalococcoidia bacterium]|uniref:TolB family protein n=1 Tax=Candidatus Amarobacter glycogenicus TaxID=3140699 RepID=UPI003136A0AF|nr:hypothetical protein [Dehalococcoidia bacterium]